MSRNSSRLTVILLAIFVTFLWSTSWILIKIGLRNDLPAVTFAGLRYTLAFLCLAPFVLFNRERRRELKSLDAGAWRTLVLLGILIYTVTQAAQYLALGSLPAATLNLVLNLTPMFVGITGIYTIGEKLTAIHWIGILLTVLGVGTYFLPVDLPAGQAAGILFGLACLAGNVAASLFGRKVNRGLTISPLIVTFISMGAGSCLMLALGLLTQGAGALSLLDWAMIAWLAVVNTGFAFTIWNHTLRTLSALESSVINGLMMPQIAVLAYLFLGEAITPKELAGLAFVGVGVLIVQWRRRSAPALVEISVEQSQ